MLHKSIPSADDAHDGDSQNYMDPFTNEHCLKHADISVSEK